MDKSEWFRTNKGLCVAAACITAELKKLGAASQQLSNLDAAGLASQAQCSALFATVADAKLRLVVLQKQVQQGQQQQPRAPTFIQDLAASISSFTELLISLKAQQRQQYGSLLQQEQQLLDELGTLQLCVDSIEDTSSSQATAGGFLGSSTSCSYTYNSGSDEACLQDSFCCGASRQDSPSKLRRQRSAGGSASKDNAAANSMSRTRPSTASSTAAATGRPGSSHQHVPGTTSSSSRSSSGRVSLSQAVGGARSCTSSSSTLLPEVVAYDEFVAQHGATGGWHPDDHNTFVALLRRSRGDYSAALATIVDTLPGKSRQAVITHSRWHADLTELDMRRRVALVSWRAARDAAKAARQAEAATLQDTQATLQAQMQAPDQLDKEVRELQKQAVAQWKAERAAQEAAQQRQEEERQRWQRQQQAEQLQRKQAELKQQIVAAKAAKQQAAEATAAAAAAQAGYQTGAAQLLAVQQQQQQAQALAQQRVTQRNAAAMARKQQLLAAKEEKQAAREKVQQQLLEQLQDAAAPKAARDPGRLLAVTAAAAARAATAAGEAAQRQKQAEGTAASRGSMGGGFVLHLGHKAVPAWASGMRL